MKRCAGLAGLTLVLAATMAAAQEPEGGIGVLTSKHNGAGLVILHVVQNSPAAKAGLKPGFIITEVDGKSLANMAVGNARSLLRGAPGTVARVELTDPKDFEKKSVVHIARQRLLVRKAPARAGALRVEWDIPREGEEPVAQFSPSDSSVADKIGQVLRKDKIPHFIDGDSLRIVHVPPSRVPKAKEILQNLRTQGHESLRTLTSGDGSVTVDEP